VGSRRQNHSFSMMHTIRHCAADGINGIHESLCGQQGEALHT
jgi:hypothetical protein